MNTSRRKHEAVHAMEVEHKSTKCLGKFGIDLRKKTQGDELSPPLCSSILKPQFAIVQAAAA
eukprot:6478403-Amphidinium_carterae.2